MSPSKSAVSNSKDEYFQAFVTDVINQSKTDIQSFVAGNIANDRIQALKENRGDFDKCMHNQEKLGQSYNGGLIMLHVHINPLPIKTHIL